jgi:hypothetical protein
LPSLEVEPKAAINVKDFLKEGFQEASKMGKSEKNPKNQNREWQKAKQRYKVPASVGSLGNMNCSPEFAQTKVKGTFIFHI